MKRVHAGTAWHPRTCVCGQGGINQLPIVVLAVHRAAGWPLRLRLLLLLPLLRLLLLLLLCR